MPTGSVKWFNPDKGFGFVAPDDGSDDRFVHRTGLADPYAADLAEGDRVSFEIGQSQRGPVATQVRVIERSGNAPRPRSTERTGSRYDSYGSSDSYGGSSYGGGSYGDSYGSAPRPASRGRSFVSQDEIDAAPVVRGTVKRYDSERGFGFIAPDDGQNDVFVHHSALGGAQIRPGDVVEFRSVPGERGPRAERVELIRD
jgi:CspA family cold shock protein